MRQWAIDAGLIDVNIHDQCKIVYEPDCASLAIQYEINRDKAAVANITDDSEDDDDTKGDNTEDGNFSKGDKYILVDAGGGTTDIACHQILGSDGEYGVKEILAPSGGAWGSCYIDDQFIKLLKEIFKPEWIEEFENEQSNIYTELLDNFQRAKAEFYKKKNKSHNVEFPIDFVYFLQSKLENEEGIDAEIEDAVAHSTAFGKRELEIYHLFY